jgi:ADP-ribosylglycohydrolase
VNTKIKGSIVGLACGDALGAPVEFLNQTELITRYGSGGIRDLEESYGVEGAYTDDTQMTLSTAEGVVAARTAEGDGINVDPVPYIYGAYIEWRRGQLDHANNRGPGNTCLSALSGGVAGSSAAPVNNSKGCGGVMRVAPVGLVYSGTRAWKYGLESAALTHGHEGGFLPAAFQALMLARIMAAPEKEAPAKTITEAVGAAMNMLERSPRSEDRDTFAAMVTQAMNLHRQTKWSDEMVLRKLGAGWVGDEALAMSIFCAMRYPNSFEGAVTSAVNYSGDRDSVGCITGAIMGALLGYSSIPERWAAKVENYDLLVSVAEQLSEVRIEPPRRPQPHPPKTVGVG